MRSSLSDQKCLTCTATSVVKPDRCQMASINAFCSFLSVCLIFLSVRFNTALEPNPIKEDFIEKLKKLNISWVAGPSPTDLPANYTPPERERKKTCVNCPVVMPSKDQTPPPRFFDTRNKWRSICWDILSRIRHQGQCDSSWAIVTASMLSDRLCIATGGRSQVHLSAEHVLNCCQSCRLGGSPGCQGGSIDEAVQFWINTGLVTGGEVNSGEGCIPYSTDSFDGMNQECPTKCTNVNYPKTMESDTYKGGQLYSLPAKDEATIRQELFNKGPVAAKMTVYEDLEFYKDGVYVHILGKSQGLHFVKIIGYGVEDGKKYWLLANSHGVAYGRKGFVKLLRGVNHCNIEENIIAVNIESTPEPVPPEQTEPPEIEVEPTDDADEPDERAAKVNDGQTLEPPLGKYVLTEIIFFCLYLHLYT